MLGNGAREHCIGETLKRSPQGCELGVYASARNPGLVDLASEYQLTESLMDFDGLVRFAKEFKPDFAFIGPDDPIAAGAADALETIGIQSVAPNKILAQLESSKSFARDLVKKYQILGNPDFRVFTNAKGLRSYIEKLGDYVVKADGLMGGKGVKVSGEHLDSFDDGENFALECLENHGRVLVEEKLIGQEFSLMSFADGLHLIDMPAIQDHKRAFDGDTGPNTGGMGTYSDANHSLPFLRTSDLEEAHAITQAVMDAAYKETGIYYKGILYGGFIAVKDGVRLIEYNARFGDPETMNVLPLLKTDFIELCEAVIEQRLDQINVEFENKATVVKYIVPEGYPTKPTKGEKIEIGTIPPGVKIYYASLDKKEDGLYLLGSRALAFVGIGETLAEAEAQAQSAVSCVTGPVFYRKDIGTQKLIQKRIDHMKELRG